MRMCRKRRGKRESGNGGGSGRQRDGVLTLCLVEKHCLAPWHTQEHTQISTSHTHKCTEHQRLFKLLIKRLAPSSYVLKLAEGVRVQEILAFLTHEAYKGTWLKQHLYDINTVPNGQISMI